MPIMYPTHQTNKRSHHCQLSTGQQNAGTITVPVALLRGSRHGRRRKASELSMCQTWPDIQAPKQRGSPLSQSSPLPKPAHLHAIFTLWLADWPKAASRQPSPSPLLQSHSTFNPRTFTQPCTQSTNPSAHPPSPTIRNTLQPTAVRRTSVPQNNARRR